MPSHHSNVMGGSSAARRIHCIGSYQAEKDLPGTTSEYAQEGTMLHAAMELMIAADPQTEKDIEKNLQSFIGQKLLTDYDQVITQEHVDSKLRPAYDAWLRLVEKYDIVDWFIEQQVSFGEIVPGAFGTSDVICFTEFNDRLIVVDWKFGDGVPVPAKDNYGMLFYAAAATQDEDDPELIESIDALPDDFPVSLVIIQPRRGHDDDPLDIWETDDKAVDDFIDLLVTTEAKMHLDSPPRTPGSQCQWCKAKAICPARKKVASTADTKIDLPGITAVELAANIKLAGEVMDWGKSVLAFAQQQAENGVQIPGYKLVAKRAARVWNDEKETEKIMKRRKCKVADMYNQKVLSPAQAEKKFPDLYKRVFAEGVSKVSSGTTLVPDTDKRPAVVDTGHLLGVALAIAGIK